MLLLRSPAQSMQEWKGLTARFTSSLTRFGVALPAHLSQRSMHLDPDFDHLTYGDQGERANQLKNLKRGDQLVFYAGLKDISGRPHLIYAIISTFWQSTI